MSERRFPQAAMSASREELKDAPMEVVEGRLPDGLSGFYYWMGPVGNVQDGGPPFPNRPSAINGDGMVYRLNLGASPPSLRTCVNKPPDYWADQGSIKGSGHEDLRFMNHGLLRLSFRLGSRNFGNTALLPMQFSNDDRPRLLVCFDPARPLEIDPETLETVTPVGYNSEWRPVALEGQAFPPVLSTAHPFFDGHTNELFTVNFGRSVLSMLETIPAFRALGALPALFERTLWRLLNVFKVHSTPPRWLQGLQRGLSGLGRRVSRLLGGDIPASFLYLMRWNGVGPLERWKVVLPDGSPAAVSESMHQVAVTRQYVVLMDTNFKLDLDQFLNNPFPESPAVERLLRAFITSPQGSETILYVIRRSDLDGGGERVQDGESERTVTAKRIAFPLGAVHFLADYDDADDRIRIHVAHGCALDIAEWVHSYDRSIYDEGTLPERLQGQVAGAADISRLGRYEIDGREGTLIGSEVVSSDALTWGIALYAGRDIPAWGRPPDRIESLYWFTAGFWTDTISSFIYDLYADYRYRQASLEQIRRMDGQNGRPSTLFRLDTHTMRIADAYAFEGDTTLSSPQFVPRSASAAGQTEGYIVCPVWTMEHNQVWIFDAGDLAAGPLCKLQGGPEVSFGFSMHSAYLPTVAPRTATYAVDPRVDYGPKIKGKKRLEEFFETQVYPYCS